MWWPATGLFQYVLKDGINSQPTLQTISKTLTWLAIPDRVLGGGQQLSASVAVQWTAVSVPWQDPLDKAGLAALASLKTAFLWTRLISLSLFTALCGYGVNC